MSRFARFVVVLSVAFGVFSTTLGAWLGPDFFFPETVAGAYKQYDYFRGDPNMPIRIERLGPGSAYGDAFREQCPSGWRTEPFEPSRHGNLAPWYRSEGADTDVLCRTVADYVWSASAILIAFGILPLILLAGRATFNWIRVGK